MTEFSFDLQSLGALLRNEVPWHCSCGHCGAIYRVNPGREPEALDVGDTQPRVCAYCGRAFRHWTTSRVWS